MIYFMLQCKYRASEKIVKNEWLFHAIPLVSMLIGSLVAVFTDSIHPLYLRCSVGTPMGCTYNDDLECEKNTAARFVLGVISLFGTGKIQSFFR